MFCVNLFTVAVLATTFSISESSFGESPSHSYDLSKHSDLRNLYNSKVSIAERMKRSLSYAPNFKFLLKTKFSHSGVRVTLQKDDSKWLIHKGNEFGIDSQTVVVDAKHMSSDWTVMDKKDFKGCKTVADFVNDGGSNYHLIFDNCHFAVNRMMEDKCP